MASRFASADLRVAEMTRQDSGGHGPAALGRSSSSELAHSHRPRTAGRLPPPAIVQPLQPKIRSPARTARPSSLKASATREAPRPASAGTAPVDFFPTQFQPTAPGTERSVITVKSSEEFWDHIDANPDRLVVLMSKSYGCRPCKAFNKKYERVAGQNRDAVFLEIFGDESEDTREMMIDMCVKVTPTFHMFKAGRLCHMHTGISEDNLRNAVTSHEPHYDPAQP